MSRWRTFLTVVLWVSAGILAAPRPADAKNLALLIGVSNYQLSTIPKLKAPGNDVRLIFDVLLERNFAKEDIIVLADDMAAGGEAPVRVLQPTAQNILQELGALAANVHEGDFVIVYFSGHGTYIPQPRPKLGEFIEPDANNEVLLAIDAQQFDTITRELRGGIVDKVLKQKFDALNNRAFLWLILDSCHAGGLTREPSVDVEVRFVDPHRDLKIPEVAQSPPTAPSPPPAAGKDVERGYQNPWINPQPGGKQVAFLAAPEDHPAFERPVTELGGKHFGLFTRALVETLRAENFGSYRQLARGLVRAQLKIPGNVPTPVFEGDLDHPLFDGSLRGPVKWPAQLNQQTLDVQIEAGALHGIREGTVVTFERDNRILSYGEVVSAGISTSRARPKAYNNRPVASAADLDGRLLAGVVQSVVNFTLKVALPPSADGAAGGSDRIGLAAINLLAAEPKPLLPITWVRAGTSDADVHLRVIGGVIYLVRQTGELVREGRFRTPAVGIFADAKSTAENLRENLWLILRQQNLHRIAGEKRDTSLAEAVEVTLRLIRDDGEFKQVEAEERQACKSWYKSSAASPKVIVPGKSSGIRLTHCDRVKVEITNRWPKPVDVTLLYVDSEGGIEALSKSEQARIPAGSAQFPQEYGPITIITWCDANVWPACKDRVPREFEPVGTEYLMIIIAEGETTSRTFHYLEQRTLSKAIETRGKMAMRGPSDDFEALLRDAGLVPEQRHGEVEKGGDATIKTFQWEVVPPSELLPGKKGRSKGGLAR